MSAIKAIKSEVAAVEPERIRWVRYAADCAERVLGLTGAKRQQAEAAIRAARAWADNPTPERSGACRTAVDAATAADAGAYATTNAAAFAADAAAFAAAAPGPGAVAASYAAANAATAAHAAADTKDSADSAYTSERAWQAERRRIYRLEVDPMGDRRLA